MSAQVFIKPISPDYDEASILISKLDAYQISLYGIENCNLDSVNTLLQSGAFMVGAYVDNRLIAIGAVKIFSDYGEIKRMFIESEFRGKGIAEKILQTLEGYTYQKGKRYVRLETGNLHHAALRFYEKQGYNVIDQFGNYKPNSISIYFEKQL